MQLPQLGQRQVVYEDPFSRIYRITADFGGFQKEYFVRDSGHRVGLVVVDNDSVLLVRQYRLLVNNLAWEIPGGKVDEGERPEAAAVRECLEETGVRCKTVKPLLAYQMGTDAVHNPTHLFYTTEFEDTGQRPQNGSEVVDHAWLSLPCCVERVFAQQIVDSFSIIGILSYYFLHGQL